jgi:hypothetical protein
MNRTDLEALKGVERRGLHEGIGALIGRVPQAGETNVAAQLRDDLLAVADALPDLIRIADLARQVAAIRAAQDYLSPGDKAQSGLAGSLEGALKDIDRMFVVVKAGQKNG